MNNEKNIGGIFFKYVSLNILGMFGISLYILADTFFISKAEGATGVAALNLVLPIYSVIYAIGAMIGVGSATCFNLDKARSAGFAYRHELDNGYDDSKKKPDRPVKVDSKFFTNAVIWAFILGIIFMIPGGLFPDKILTAIGGDEEILRVGVPYTRIFMLFAPGFMLNHIFNAFVRNDDAPSLAMAATLSSSIFNIVMDYVFMFPLGMGMAGAALATAISPLLGVLICSIHFFSKTNTIRFRWMIPDFKSLLFANRLGISAFVGEISSGVTTAVFNAIILGISGNIGLAAYGVVANTALVAVAIFNGVAQGSQPLISDYYGKGQKKNAFVVLKMGIITAISLAFVIVFIVHKHAVGITSFFNSEHNEEMAKLAVTGLRLYFLGFLFAGVNIVVTGYLSATEHAKSAFATSVLRGFVAIIICAVVMSRLMGMQGVWLAFPTAELITILVIAVIMLWGRRK